MNVNKRTGIEPALAIGMIGCWLIVGLSLASCGGHRGLPRPNKTSTDGSASASAGGAGSRETGGSMAGGSGGQDEVTSSSEGGISGSTQGTGFGTGGLPSQGGGSGYAQDAGTESADAFCDVGALWEAVSSGAVGFGYCLPGSFAGGILFGDVVINKDGQVVDITGISSKAKRAWLDGLAEQRWPCLANQTITYSCSIPA